MVERALELNERLPPPLQEAQARAILAVVGEHLLAQLKAMAMNPDKIPESPGVKHLRLLLEEQGRVRGKAEGKVEGKAEGKQESVLAFLDARGIPVTARQRARILACNDLEVLADWTTRAASVTSTRDLLGEDAASGARRTRSRVPPKRATTRRAAAEK